jgi:uncharacterized protein
MAWRGWGLALAALGALVTLGRGEAFATSPSFECSAAKAPIELLICGHDALAKADADLATLYRQLQSSLDDAARNALRTEQRSWLQARFRSCGIPQANTAKIVNADKAAACLTALYNDRIAVLNTQAAALAGSTASTNDSTPPNAAAGGAVPLPAPESLPTQLGLEKSVLLATGKQSTILSIAAFGRYSLSVKSQQGVALQLVDRMIGPGAVMGAAGESDGRLDTFLDRGHYKILLQASDKGSGDAALAVHPFAELNGPELPRLPDIKRIDTALDDYKQRSYWIEVTERRTVAIEAAGRNLADLRLWRDGNWLIDATPASEEIEPRPGEPLTVQRLVTVLEPGLYQLSAYGGPAKPWAKTSDAHPLYLRMGIPTLDAALRQTFIASPLGIDRFLVPATASFFRLELPEAEDAHLSVVDYTESEPYATRDGGVISKKTNPPVAEVYSGSGREEDYKVVTITREAGKPYILQCFQSVNRYDFDVAGSYWLQTLHSGYGEDNVDATGLLTKRRSDYPEQVIADNAPELRPGAAWARRFNMLDTFTVYFHVTETGTYMVQQSGGADGEYRFEPMVHFPADYKRPEFADAGKPWKLDPGYYVLTGRPKPEGKGIVDLKVVGEGVASANTSQAKETSVSFPRLALDDHYSYTLYLNEQPGVAAGVILRSLPIELARGLPVVLKAGQSLDIPVRAPGDGMVTAITEDAKPSLFAIDHAAPVAQWRGDGGTHILTIGNPTDKAMTLALRFDPDALAPATPLPRVSPEALAAIPSFPPLTPERPEYFDVARAEQKTFALDVAEPGLYRVESRGLLQTEAAVRTRTILSLDREESNGTGRNFLIQQYLGQGQYQLTLAPQGDTTGHMGVVAAKTDLIDGGALSLGIPARNTLRAGDGIVYNIRIPQAGRYHLAALGLGRTYRMRLEDQDGWPIIPPNGAADYTGDFEAGFYRLVILPQPVDAKIVTLLEAVVTPPEPSGHGPHDLALGASRHFQWLEPEAGAVRVPDQWRFTLTGPAHVAITLSRGMRADVVAEADGMKRDEVNGGEPWSRLLPAGTYLLKATTIEPNNRFDYDVSVSAQELLAGESRAISLPADVPVSIGSDAVAEIGSFGTADVRAWLYDAEDKLVATNDDRPNDWNFAIAGRIKPGFYRLHVEAVGSAPAAAPQPAASNDNTVEDGENDQTSESGSEDGEDQQESNPQTAPARAAAAQPGDTTISIYQAEEQIEPALAVGSDTRLSGQKVHLVPLTPASGDVLVAAADAGGPAVGLGLEIADGTGWRTLGESVGRSPWLALPEGEAGRYRLRVWSIDRSSDPIRVQTRMASPKPAAATQFTGGGIPLQTVSGITPPLGLAAVTVNAAGAYQLARPLPGIAWSTAPGKPLQGDFANVAFGQAGTFWFGARLSSDSDAGTDAAGIVAASAVTPGRTPVSLTVPGADHGAAVIMDPAKGSTPLLWRLESRVGQPGIGGDGLVGAVAAGSAVAIAPTSPLDGAALHLWNAGDSAAPLPASLRRFDFAMLPARSEIGWGASDRAVQAQPALTMLLPKGKKRLALALPPDTAVVLGKGRTDAVWSGDAPLAISLDSEAESLLAISASDFDQKIGLTVTPLDPGDAYASLGGGRIFKRYFATAGVVRLQLHRSDSEVKSKAPLRLKLDGAATQATLLQQDGTVSRDPQARVSGDGIVDIAHGAGVVVAWLDGGDPLTGLQGVAPTPVTQTAAIVLKGDAQQIVFNMTAPKLLHLKTATPVIVQQKPSDGAPELRLYANGADLSLYLPKGATPLVLRAAGAGDLAGIAEATLSDIAPLAEGLGPRVRLAPGESRLYSFTLKDERDIGVGVRDASDSAHCRVFDAAGNTIGTGVVQMLHLKAGTYLLAVDAPSDGSAIEVQPALVGVAAPDGGPPDDVKRSYLELAGLKPKTNP